MTEEDFAAHTVELSQALAAEYDGVEYLSAGANSQGLYFLQGLRALDVARSVRGPLDPLGRDAGVVASVLAWTAGDRDRHCADPDWSSAPVDHLLSDTYARRVAEHALSGTAVDLLAQRKASGDTVAVVVADADGTWVSLIQSVFHSFGAAVLDPGTGIVLHNRGASFSLDPASPNVLAGGKRPLHTLMPVLVREGANSSARTAPWGTCPTPGAHPHGPAARRRFLSRTRRVGATLGPGSHGGRGDGWRGRRQHRAGRPPAGVQAIEEAGFTVRSLGANDDGVGHGQLVRRVPGDGRPHLAAAADPRADGSAVAG